MGTLYVKILGSLWMGGDAATDRTLKVGKGPFQADIEDPTDADQVENHIHVYHGGDFSRIEAIEAICVERFEHHADTNPIGPNQIMTRTSYVEIETTVLEMTEDQLCRWSDATYGSEDYG